MKIFWLSTLWKDARADFAKIIKKGDFVIVRELIANAI